MDNQTLENILEENALGAIFERATAVQSEFMNRPDTFTDVSEAMARARQDQAILAQVKLLDQDAEDFTKKMAEIFDLELERAEGFVEFQKEMGLALSEILTNDSLKESWNELLQTAPIQKIGLADFPTGATDPFIVFYSADWCGPCHAIKPTFARIAPFFDKATLYYSNDEELAAREETKFWPQLVAYFPDGRKVRSVCGDTAQELWDTLNLLITQGEMFDGDGMLVCDEEGCHIEPGQIDPPK